MLRNNSEASPDSKKSYYAISEITRLLYSVVKKITVISLLIVLSGCAALSSYDNQSVETLDALRSGNINLALAKYQDLDPEKKKPKILPYLEKGSIEFMASDAESAIQSWKVADAIVQEWEEKSKLDATKVAGNVGSIIVNDKVQTYEAANYEKVFLTTSMAVAQASMGNWDIARTEIKKTHERESIIANVNGKKYAEVEEEAEKADHKVKSYKELDGYPVEIFESQKVLKLKNSYQNALSHYLAGYIYEALGESSLSAPGYRKAIELNPSARILERGLAELETRSGVGNKAANTSDVLFVLYSGEIAAKKSQTISIPVATANGLIVTPISFPIYQPSPYHYSDLLTVNGAPITMEAIMDVDSMAIRELKDEMPGILLRSTIRAAAKSLAQKEVQDQNVWAGLAMSVAAVLTESADERMWRTLPSNIKLHRQNLSYGEHSITVGGKLVKIAVNDDYTVIPIRVVGNNVYSNKFIAAEVFDASNSTDVSLQ